MQKGGCNNGLPRLRHCGIIWHQSHFCLEPLQSRFHDIKGNSDVSTGGRDLLAQVLHRFLVNHIHKDLPKVLPFLALMLSQALMFLRYTLVE